MPTCTKKCPGCCRTLRCKAPCEGTCPVCCKTSRHATDTLPTQLKPKPDVTLDLTGDLTVKFSVASPKGDVKGTARATLSPDGIVVYSINLPPGTPKDQIENLDQLLEEAITNKLDPLD